VYKTVNFTRLEMTWQEHIPFFFRNHYSHRLTEGGRYSGRRSTSSSISTRGADRDERVPVYSIGGNDLAVAGLAYRFPISSNLDFRFLQIYFDKLYASFYGDIGNAWVGEKQRHPGRVEGGRGGRAAARIVFVLFVSDPLLL